MIRYLLFVVSLSVLAAPLDRYDAYLAGLSSMTAHVQQCNPNGSVVHGTLYIKKPGCLRLIYQPQGTKELIANGEDLIQYDGQTKDSDTIALSRTPLYFLLQDKGRLSDHAHIRSLNIGPKWTKIVLQSKHDSDAGDVTLIFQENPLQLVRWSIKDPQGNKTVVTLSKIHKNAPIESRIFRMRR